MPLVSADGAVLAAINISAHAARRTVESLLEDCLPVLRQTQAKLRRQL